MSKKEFDKNEFKKSQDKMAIIFLILFKLLNKFNSILFYFIS